MLNAMSVISRYSRTFFERRLRDINLGFTEHNILIYLNKNDVVNQEQISKHFMLDKGAVAKALNKLEEKNYISRSDNPMNKREKLVKITEHGKSIIGLLHEELQEWHDYLFEGISKSEIEAYIQTTQKMAANAARIINERSGNNGDKKQKD